LRITLKSSSHAGFEDYSGTTNYKEANSIMAQFDLAILHFVGNELVKSMSPIKLDDYKRTKCPTVVLDTNKSKSFESMILEELKKSQNSRLNINRLIP
jgi:hypothetical protein